MLLDCNFLLDAAIGGANDIDTSDRDVGVDGLARLDGVVGNGESTYVIDVHIGLITELGNDTDGAMVNRECEVAITKIVTRGIVVIIVTKGKWRVDAVESDVARMRQAGGFCHEV